MNSISVGNITTNRNKNNVIAPRIMGKNFQKSI